MTQPSAETLLGSDPRADELERCLGDPWDEDNPIGFSAVLAADERGEVLTAGEHALDAYGLNAELIPPQYGGRLRGLDRLIRLMRSVTRRDASLAFGYGTTSLMAAVNIWTSGSEEQRRTVADLLLRHAKLACAFHELPHGNDLTHVELTAESDVHGLWLNGCKQVIGNIERADAFLAFVRVSGQPGSRSHSQLLIDKASLPTDGFRYLPRFPTSGLRGLQLGGIEFVNCRLSADHLVGTPGQGVETAMRAFQVTRVVLPGMTVGVLDTALRTGLRFALNRRLYGRTVADLPYPRSILVDAFADLLLGDCFTTVAARALHLLPREAGVVAAAVKYLVPEVQVQAVRRLATMVGAQFYLRTGDHAMMQKLVRDIQPTSFMHASKATCQMTLLPQLPLLAKRSWQSAEPVPRQLLQLEDDLPALPFDDLAVSASGQDRLGAALLTAADTMPDDSPDQQHIRRLIQALAEELRELSRQCAALSPAELSVAAPRRSYRLVDRYALLLAASCCVSVWTHNQKHADPFLRDTSWLIAVLTRLAARLGLRTPSLPEQVRTDLFDELLRRHKASIAFDLTGQQLSPWPH